MTRVVLALAMIVGSELAIQLLGQSLAPAMATPPETPLEQFPNVLGSWSGEDVKVDERLVYATGGYSVINRAYANAAGARVALDLTLWLDYLPQVPHPPEICYPGSGWELIERKLIQVPSSASGPFMARLAVFEKRAQRVAVLYWIKLGPTVALDDGDVRRVLQQNRGFGKTRPPAIKVMIQADALDLAAAERQVVEFAATVSPHLNMFDK